MCIHIYIYICICSVCLPGSNRFVTGTSKDGRSGRCINITENGPSTSRTLSFRRPFCRLGLYGVFGVRAGVADGPFGPPSLTNCIAIIDTFDVNVCVVHSLYLYVVVYSH